LHAPLRIANLRPFAMAGDAEAEPTEKQALLEAEALEAHERASILVKRPTTGKTFSVVMYDGWPPSYPCNLQIGGVCSRPVKGSAIGQRWANRLANADICSACVVHCAIKKDLAKQAVEEVTRLEPLEMSILASCKESVNPQDLAVMEASQKPKARKAIMKAVDRGYGLELEAEVTEEQRKEVEALWRKRIKWSRHEVQCQVEQIHDIETVKGKTKVEAQQMADNDRPPGWKGRASALKLLVNKAQHIPNMDFSGLDFWGLDISDLKLFRANLYKMKHYMGIANNVAFHSSNMGNSFWVQASMLNCKFDQANLAGAVMAAAILRGSTFKRADLTGAVLSGCDLRNCNFDGATLANAAMKGAIFTPYKVPKKVTSVVYDALDSHSYVPMKDDDSDGEGSSSSDDDDATDAGHTSGRITKQPSVANLKKQVPGKRQRSDWSDASLKAEFQDVAAAGAWFIPKVDEVVRELIQDFFNKESKLKSFQSQLFALDPATKKLQRLLYKVMKEQFVYPLFDTCLTNKFATLQESHRKLQQKTRMSDKKAQVAPDEMVVEMQSGRDSPSSEPSSNAFKSEHSKLEAIENGLDQTKCNRLGEMNHSLSASLPYMRNAFKEEMFEIARPLMGILTMRSMEGQSDKFEGVINSALHKMEDKFESLIVGHTQAAVFDSAHARIARLGQNNRSLNKLGNMMDKLEEFLARKLKKIGDIGPKMAELYTPQGQFSTMLRNKHLLVATAYDCRLGIKGVWDLARLVVFRPRQALLTDQREIQYMLDELLKLKEEKPTELTWRSVSDAFEALIEMRTQMGNERGQAVIDCIVCDRNVMGGIAAAEQLTNISGSVPNDIISIFTEGPCGHIRLHFYRYRQVLEYELVRVSRVIRLQETCLNLVSQTVLACLIAAANFLSRFVYDFLFPSSGGDEEMM
jgi:uncharacterized protein YjbI with pentapeptide repeats